MTKQVTDEAVIMISYDGEPSFIIRKNGEILTYKLKKATMEDMKMLVEEEEKDVITLYVGRGGSGFQPGSSKTGVINGGSPPIKPV